jgi:Fe-S-cluster-containing dehydrogenase component
MHACLLEGRAGGACLLHVYMCVFSAGGLLLTKTVIHGRACASCRRPRCMHVCWYWRLLLSNSKSLYGVVVAHAD